MCFSGIIRFRVFSRRLSFDYEPSSLNPMAIVALLKCFVLEWSNELDSILYHDLPLKIYLT